MSYVAGEPPETEADWRRVADTLPRLHGLTQSWPQRPGWRSSTDLLDAETGTRFDLGAMPPEEVARCRAAWARLTGHQTCVIHSDPTPGDIRMTADRVGIIDWDESHVDAADFDLVLPHNAADSATVRTTSPRKRSPRGTPPVAGATSLQSSSSPKLERSDCRFDAPLATPSIVKSRELCCAVICLSTANAVAGNRHRRQGREDRTAWLYSAYCVRYAAYTALVGHARDFVGVLQLRTVGAGGVCGGCRTS